MDAVANDRVERPERRPSWGDALAATRRSLLTRLKRSDDHDGWQRFFDTYASVIHAFGIRAGLTPAEADDALQETLLSVAKEMPEFRYDPARGSFKAWLFLISRRRIADQFRRRMRAQRDGNDVLEAVAEAPDPNAHALSPLWDEEWRENQLQIAIERVKSRVGARQWQMFDLAALQNWPTEKICSLLGVNRAQIYMARMRINRLLKAEVRSLRPDGPLPS
jgi:RNA polymerase sigma factor (sigma-70 family)